MGSFGGLAFPDGLDPSGILLGGGTKAVPRAVNASPSAAPCGLGTSGVPFEGERAVPCADNVPPRAFPGGFGSSDVPVMGASPNGSVGSVVFGDVAAEGLVGAVGAFARAAFGSAPDPFEALAKASARTPNPPPGNPLPFPNPPLCGKRGRILGRLGPELSEDDKSQPSYFSKY